MTELLPVSYSLHEILARWSGASDPERIQREVERLTRSRIAEEEFLLMCRMLGYCPFIHKLDQSTQKGSKLSGYAIPDLIARFVLGDLSLVVAIEVKFRKKAKLRINNKSVHQLREYGQHLAVPVLIAWKHPATQWVLFDIECMTPAGEAYEIAIGDALTEDLFGILAGDANLDLEPGLEVRLNLVDYERKEKMKARKRTVQYLGGTVRNARLHHPSIGDVFTTNSLLNTVIQYVAGAPSCDEMEDKLELRFKIERPMRLRAQSVLLHHFLQQLDPSATSWRTLINKWPPLPSISTVIEELAPEAGKGLLRTLRVQKPAKPPHYLPTEWERGRKQQGCVMFQWLTSTALVAERLAQAQASSLDESSVKVSETELP